LGWAQITHPFHPRRGQRFGVLKSRRVGGIDTLILRDAERGSFAVPLEWTDLAAPATCDGSTGRFGPYLLCDLASLIEALIHRSTGGLAK